MTLSQARRIAKQVENKICKKNCDEIYLACCILAKDNSNPTSVIKKEDKRLSLVIWNAQ